jgi:hypothetical protein
MRQSLLLWVPKAHAMSSCLLNVSTLLCLNPLKLKLVPIRNINKFSP